jgi:hypothetical protein
MFWKALALLGSGSFFVVGFDIATDPNCDSVSFRGGGARSVLTTCFADTTGDFSKSFAVIGSFLVGIAILTFIFWEEINAYIRNLELRERFESRLDAAIASYNDKPDSGIEKSSASIYEPDNSRSRFLGYWMRFSKLAKEKKVISLVLVIVLMFGFYRVVAPKIPIFDSLTCSGLRSEVKELDILRRDSWNLYQEEVSRLGQISSDDYYVRVSQVENVARRLVQLRMIDLDVTNVVLETGHCLNVQRSSVLVLQTTIQGDIDFLQGKRFQNGEKWNPYSGWDSEYYDTFTNLIGLVD